MSLYFRSILFIPGNRPDMLAKLPRYTADAYAPDMEDSVRIEDKAAARQTIRENLSALAAHGKPLVPRVNALETGLLEEDLAAVVGPGVPMVQVGKIKTEDDIRAIDAILARLEAQAGLPVGHTRILPWMETPLAILRAYDIFTSSPRVTAAAFGADDFAATMGVARGQNPLENLYPRAHLGVAARAANVHLMDSSCVHFRDLGPLERECDEALMLGYGGKFAIHPAQVEIINAKFAPSAEKIAWAQKIIAIWDSSPAGRGALNVDGVMVDEPYLKQCHVIMDQARRYGLA